MLTLTIENDKLPFGTLRQVQYVMRNAAAARITAEDQIEYYYQELGKILKLSERPRYFVTRGGHHVALVDDRYPHTRQVIILEAQP